jgi:hypothetical protein
MKALALCAVSALALSTAACAQRDSHSAAMTGRLDCPEQAGDLKRTSISPDGKSCEYQIADGAHVSLKLVALDAKGPDTLLTRLETDLRAEAATDEGVQTAETDAAKAVEEARQDAAEAQKAEAEARADSEKAWSASDSARDASEISEVERTVDSKLKERGLSEGDQSASVVLPGVRIDADGKDDSAHISMPGVRIDAEGDGAAIRLGRMHIDTDNDKAVVKAVSDVRLRGEGLARTKRGIQAMFVYAGDNLGGGYKYVGYEVAGPKTGPLTVAIIKSKKSGGFHGDVYGDVKRLVRRNGGV